MFNFHYIMRLYSDLIYYHCDMELFKATKFFFLKCYLIFFKRGKKLNTPFLGYNEIQYPFLYYNDITESLFFYHIKPSGFIID